MIGIVIFSMMINGSESPSEVCAENVNTESAKEYMLENKMNEEEYFKACVYSYKFYVYAFSFLLILVIVPFRAWWTFVLISWEQAGKDDNQEDLVY